MAKTANSTGQVIGLHFDCVSVITDSGELKPLLKGFQVTMNPKATSTREFSLKAFDYAPDLLGGTLAALSAIPTDNLPGSLSADLPTVNPVSDDAGLQVRGPKQRKEGLAPARSTTDLVGAFLQGFDFAGIADLRKGDGVKDLTIGITKKDRKWKGRRLFLFKVALDAMFPDGAERRLLLKELQAREILVPHPTRTDTLTVPVQVEGRTLKAYRLRRGKLKAALASR